jgi:hypothetical protein
MIFLLVQSNGASAAANPVEQKRLQVLKMLNTQKYFKYSSCTEIANAVLRKSGLPVLGKAGPIKGTRGQFSRPAKRREPPTFKDEITGKGPEKIKIRIQGLSVMTRPSGKWSLHVQRSGKIKLKSGPTPVSMDTELAFDLESHAGRKTCELTGITFKLNNKPSDKSLKPEQVSIRECIDLFMVSPAASAIEMTWIKADCALALHYSTEAKKAVGLGSKGS